MQMDAGTPAAALVLGDPSSCSPNRLSNSHVRVNFMSTSSAEELQSSHAIASALSQANASYGDRPRQKEAMSAEYMTSSCAESASTIQLPVRR